MELPELSSFLLVGGTALSLHYAHRLSVDLDPFNPQEFSDDSIIPMLEKHFKGFTYNNSPNSIGLFGFIDNIKVDFVKHPFTLIDAPLITEGVRLISIPDIIAMKINAVMKRGVKKNFWDIAELLQHYSMEDFVRFYKKKYPSQQLLISVPQALIYFDDAEESQDPVSLKGQTWDSVKKLIRNKVSNFLK